MRKSQIQIGETIAVLFVFFLIIVVGLIFYTSVIKSNISSEIEELSQLKSIEIAQNLLDMPELQCSEGIIKEKENCVDILKLGSAKAVMQQNGVYYFDIFGFGRINIRKIYPEPDEWDIYSKTVDDFKSNFSTNIPVSIYDPRTRKYSFGIASIETLIK